MLKLRLFMSSSLVALCAIGGLSPTRGMDSFCEITNESQKNIILCYREKLPLPKLQSEETGVQILNYIQEMGGGKTLNNEARIKIVAQINEFMLIDKPIDLCILGFPCKSSNAEKKVIRSEFDLADYLGLVTLQHITEGIQKIYKPGAKITIVNNEPYIEDLNTIVRKECGIACFLDAHSYENTLSILLKNFPNLCLGGDFTKKYREAFLIYPDSVLVPEKEKIDFFSKELDSSQFKMAIRKQYETNLKDSLTIDLKAEFNKTNKKNEGSYAQKLCMEH